MADGKVKDNEFNEMAIDETWGGSQNKRWSARNKTLVVVYKYSNTYMVDIAVRGQRMHFVMSPPLCILGAAFDVKCVTEKAMALVKNRSFSATANNATFEDKWTWRKKTLVVVYQYGDEPPMVATSIEGKQLEFKYTKSKHEHSSSSNSSSLTILGAAYGPNDVTAVVQSLWHRQSGSALSVTAEDETFGDPWKGHKKTLVIVSRKRGGEPRVSAVQQSETIHLG